MFQHFIIYHTSSDNLSIFDFIGSAYCLTKQTAIAGQPPISSLSTLPFTSTFIVPAKCPMVVFLIYIGPNLSKKPRAGIFAHRISLFDQLDVLIRCFSMTPSQ